MQQLSESKRAQPALKADIIFKQKCVKSDLIQWITEQMRIACARDYAFNYE